jgi:hypothetical protein
MYLNRCLKENIIIKDFVETRLLYAEYLRKIYRLIQYIRLQHKTTRPLLNTESNSMRKKEMVA